MSGIIFQHTWRWLVEPSPHTGEVKTQTRRIVKPGECFTTALSIGLVGKHAGEVITTAPTPVAALRHSTTVARPLYSVVSAGKHTRYTVGKTYAVQPGRGKPGIWWREDCGRVAYAHECWDIDAQLWAIHGNYPVEGDPGPSDYEVCEGDPAQLKNAGYQPLRVHITGIRFADVRKIGEADVQEEGYSNRAGFWLTWVAMHDKAPFKPARFVMSKFLSTEHLESAMLAAMNTRPAERYTAWALSFEVVR